MADVAVIAEGQVLFVRYRDTRPYDGQAGWFLPDDFLRDVEHPDRAAVRIGREQLGVTLKEPALGFVESFGNGAWHLIFHYRADLARKPRTRKGENVADMAWFDLSALPPPADVAHHGWCLDTLALILGDGRT